LSLASGAGRAKVGHESSDLVVETAAGKPPRPKKTKLDIFSAQEELLRRARSKSAPLDVSIFYTLIQLCPYVCQTAAPGRGRQPASSRVAPAWLGGASALSSAKNKGAGVSAAAMGADERRRKYQPSPRTAPGLQPMVHVAGPGGAARERIAAGRAAAAWKSGSWVAAARRRRHIAGKLQLAGLAELQHLLDLGQEHNSSRDGASSD